MEEGFTNEIGHGRWIKDKEHVTIRSYFVEMT